MVKTKIVCNFKLKSQNGSIKLIPASRLKLSDRINISESSFSEIEPFLTTLEDYQEYIKAKNPKFDEDFSIDQILSRGSFGIILKGRSKKYKKNFAFKLIFNKHILNQKREHCLKKIKSEIAIQQKLRHKHINPLYGFYEVADSFLYVLEYEKYGDLSNFIRMLKRPILSESLIAYISVQILKSIEYCHKLKIAHLDIKKQNILVDENLNFKLCDFSVSAEYYESDIKLHCVGSSLYISPENLNKNLIKNSEINKVDLYSFGVLLYNLAFKSYPYNLELEDTNNFEKIYNKIIHNKLDLPVKSTHSQLFRNFVEGLLEKDISKRISMNEALNHPWILAAENIFLEKEKNSDLEKFLMMIITDNINSFNNSIKGYNYC